MPDAADTDERIRRVFAALSEEPQSLEALEQETGLSAKQLRKVLDARTDVVREGHWKKGAPYTYRLPPEDPIHTLPSF